MLILHIMASRAAGGAETYSADVILSLHKAGVRQCVVMPEEAPRYAELKAAGVRLFPSVFRTKFRPLQRLLLRRLIRQERPGIVIAGCAARRACCRKSQFPSSAGSADTTSPDIFSAARILSA